MNERNDEMPPDPEGMNDARARWAGVGLDAFQEHTKTDEHNVLSDLLCDLMHWADRKGFTFEAEVTRALFHYTAETGEEQ